MLDRDALKKVAARIDAAAIRHRKKHGPDPYQELAEENERLRAALETISRTTFSGSEMDDNYQRGNRDAHSVCASMARAALCSSQQRRDTP